jgi:hypothetical protein
MPWLVGAEFLINAARGILSLALGLLLYRSTGQVWAFALAFSSEFAFSLVIQGIAGTTVDRFSSTTVLAVTSTLSALLFVVVLGSVALSSADLDSSAALLVLLSIGLNMARPFLRSSLFAVLHHAVGERGYERLNGYLAIARQVGQLTGMAATGLLMESLTALEILAVVGALHLAAAVMHVEFRRRVAHGRGGAPHSAPSRAAPLSAVIAHVRGNPEVLSLCAIATVDVALVALFNLALAPVVEAHFDGRLRWMTIFDMSYAVGALLGGAYLSTRQAALGVRPGPTLAASLAGVATFTAFALGGPPALLLPIIAAFGGLITMSTVVWQTGLQLVAPVRMKGRLGSLRLLCDSITVATATMLASLVSELRLLSVPAFAGAFAAVGLVAVAVLYSAARPRLERVQPHLLARESQP